MELKSSEETGVATGANPGNRNYVIGWTIFLAGFTGLFIWLVMVK